MLSFKPLNTSNSYLVKELNITCSTTYSPTLVATLKPYQKLEKLHLNISTTAE